MSIFRLALILIFFFLGYLNLALGQEQKVKLKIGAKPFYLINTLFIPSNFVFGVNLQGVNKAGSGPYFSVSYGKFETPSSIQLRPPKPINDWESKVLMSTVGYNWLFGNSLDKNPRQVFGFALGYYECAAKGEIFWEDTYYPANSYRVPFNQEMNTYFFEAKYGVYFKLKSNFGVEPLLVIGARSFSPNENEWVLESTPLLGGNIPVMHFRFQVLVWYEITNLKRMKKEGK